MSLSAEFSNKTLKHTRQLPICPNLRERDHSGYFETDSNSEIFDTDAAKR